MANAVLFALPVYNKVHKPAFTRSLWEPLESQLEICERISHHFLEKVVIGDESKKIDRVATAIVRILGTAMAAEYVCAGRF